MRNKQLFQKRLEQLDAIFNAVRNGINMNAPKGEIKGQVDKGSNIVAELESYVENEN
jgi:hypothetical protein|tara:strand:- start:49 stop:219 length:171 start_codon:yes stop_codon:yes gene_type:complete